MSGKDPSEELRDPVCETELTVAPGSGSGTEEKRPDERSGSEGPVTEVTIADASVQKTDVTILMQEPPESSFAGIVSSTGLQPGDHIDRYTVVRKLGQGGMGSVYLVRHETLGVFRAAKVLSSALYLRGGEFVDRFIREAKLACAISNPNIVNVLDVGEDRARGLCWLIMEYVDGGTVRDVLRKIPKLGEVHAVLIAEAVAGALTAAAQQKIVHRDIKPDNIMLTRRGEVKLADLGIAKNNEENVQLTKSHVMMGTPAYLAPEQAMDAHSVDVRADIYSLGATVFEMLTGTIPYPGKSTYDILAKLAASPVPDPRTLTETVSPQTAKLVMRMLAKDAKQRPATPEALLREIRSLNVLPPDLDPHRSIRELLECVGTGDYSPGTPTAATGNPVSTWLMRHLFLRFERFLRRVPLLAETVEFFCLKPVFFYLLLAAVTLLAVGLPLALTRGGEKELPVADAGLVLTPEPEVPAKKVPTPEAVKAPEKGAPVPAPEPKAQVKVPAPAAVKSPGKTPPVPAPEPKAQVKVPAPAPVKVPEKTPPVPAPEPKVEVKVPAPAPKTAPPAGRAVPAPVTPRKSTPPAPPVRKVEEKIAFQAEISPVGSRVVLRGEKGRLIAEASVPEGGRLKFSVPEGQYVLRVSAPGFESAEREFPISRSRTITGVKIVLRQETLLCTAAFYGSTKLLAYLRQEGVELRLDNGVWKKVTQFPHRIEMSRRPHTLSLRGRGIVPQEQKIVPKPDQRRCAVEFYLTEKDAVVEFETAVEGEVFINLAGIWEPLRKRLAFQPFRKITVKWRVGNDGEEQTLDIPELLPESFRKIVLVPKEKAVLPGEKEVAEARTLIKAGRFKEALTKLEAAGKLEHPEAFHLLGVLAEEGKGRWFASDSDALSFYRKGAEAPFNNCRSQYRMGLFYEKGRGGLKQDMVKAVEWYKKAADGKDPDALYRLSLVYRNGEGGEPVDLPRMIRYMTAAAEAGLAEAQFQLGYCCENGIGVPIGVGQAKHWYEKAAAQGHENARLRGKALEEIKE